MATKLLESYVETCSDISLKVSLSLVRIIPSHWSYQRIQTSYIVLFQVAMSSVKKDLLSQKGSLVTLYVKPRKSAKKNIYVIGGENDKTKYFRLRVSDTVC